MARIRDVPTVIRSVGLIAFIKRVLHQMSQDNLTAWASSLAYSWLFAIFPFFIFLLTLVPLLPLGGKAKVEKHVTEFIYANLPKESADDFWFNLQDILQGATGGILVRCIGLGTALWAAAGGMSMTMSALDRVYSLPVSGGRPFWKQRLLALLMTLAIIVLILSVVILLPIGSIAKELLISNSTIDANNPLLPLFDVTRWVLALVFMISVLMVLYHFGPSVKHRMRWVTPGAVFTIVVWVLLGLTFRYYVDKYGKYDKTYGSVAGVAIMLLVFYIDAVVLLIGAEINSEIDFEVLKIQRGTRNFMPAEAAVEVGVKDPAILANLGEAELPEESAKKIT